MSGKKFLWFRIVNYGCDLKVIVVLLLTSEHKTFIDRWIIIGVKRLKLITLSEWRNEKSFSSESVMDPDSIISLCEFIDVWMNRSYQSMFSVFVTRQFFFFMTLQNVSHAHHRDVVFPPSMGTAAEIRFIYKKKGLRKAEGGCCW